MMRLVTKVNKELEDASGQIFQFARL